MSDRSFKTQVTERKNRVDITLCVIVFIFVVAGLGMLYSTSSYNGQVKFHDSGYYFKKQLFATSVGLLIMYIVSRMDYHIFERLALPAYIASLFLSSLVLVIGDSFNGSKRWISLGPLSFQPAEFSKLAVILLLAFMINRCKKKITGIGKMFAILLPVLPIVALVGTNNLSTAVIILGIGAVLIFMASPGYVRFIWMGLAGIAVTGIFLGVEKYRLERLLVWRNPQAYEKGYQTLQGLYAIGSGGLFGKGLGESMQKLGFVPEAQNDMIFSIICEEFGLLGASFVIILFFLMIWRFLLISHHAKDLFGAMIAAGIMAHISIQVILNIAVVTNTIPNTGITLPFISYGGTSVMFLLAEMGLALAVSRNTGNIF